ncbi:unnamed protein product [Eruca vesicaria subsp. sativa]|uniref:HSF-type DNA-binding domain-containing protein n=1 Tax=Eruca vesicaria subsp. sativa TaxID=29727 RepID=A0ABC8KKL6_ERUVS|nr:unnamed protein product [Eruca vesicaria subsp. sativa]
MTTILYAVRNLKSCIIRVENLHPSSASEFDIVNTPNTERNIGGSPTSQSPSLSSFSIKLSSDDGGSNSSQRPIGSKNAKIKRKIAEGNSSSVENLVSSNEKLLDILQESASSREKGFEIAQLRAQNQAKQLALKEMHEENKMLLTNLDSIVYSTTHFIYRIYDYESIFKIVLYILLKYTVFFLFHSRVLSLETFVTYGFTKTVFGSQVEYANNDFVSGQPERLEKISEPYVARVKPNMELDLKLNNDGKLRFEEYTSYGTVVLRFKGIYKMVDDPETNSFISWGPNGKSFIVLDHERCAGFVPYDLLEECSFTKTVSGSQMEFTSENFMAGKPELLEKIGEKHKPVRIAYFKKLRKRMDDLLRTFEKQALHN